MQQIPPYTERLLNPDGTLSRRWYLWFQSLKVLDDQIAVQASEIFTVNAQLTTKHMGKILKFDNGIENLTCFLPSVGRVDIGGSLTIVKMGIGSLRVQAADQDVIGKSSAGGAMVSGDPARAGANLRLFLEEETRWHIVGGTGIWYVF